MQTTCPKERVSSALLLVDSLVVFIPCLRRRSGNKMKDRYTALNINWKRGKRGVRKRERERERERERKRERERF